MIGTGGMGMVWCAFDEQLRRRVAVKLLAPERLGSQKACERLQQEATTIASLENPHVVQVFDFGFEDESPYIVMELLDGLDLEATLRRKSRFTATETLRVLRQLGTAVAAAHDAQLVHGDLKPANVFLARNHAGAVVKVLDFGLAGTVRDLAESASEREQVGTPAYMSPERFRTGKIDIQSDLWAMGVILFRMLAGQAPFEAPCFDSLSSLVQHGAYATPIEWATDVPASIQGFFDRALAKDSSARFASARDMVQEFARLIERESQNPIRLLVVDDEPDVADLFRQWYRQKIKAGEYEFVFAEHGESALEVLKRQHDIDIVVTDVRMPVMDGLTLLQRLQQRTSNHMRAIILTAFDDMSNIREAMNRGAFDFLTKPIDFDDLEATILRTYEQVARERRAASSVDRHAALKMFLSPELVERVEKLDVGHAVAHRSFEATVLCINLGHPHEADVLKSGNEGVEAVNADYHIILSELATHGGWVERMDRDSVLVVFNHGSHVEACADCAFAVLRGFVSRKRILQRPAEGSMRLKMAMVPGHLSGVGYGALSAGRFSYVVEGDAVRAVQRLSEVAPPGQILLGDLGEGRPSHLPKKRYELQPTSVSDRGLASACRRISQLVEVRTLDGEQGSPPPTELTLGPTPGSQSASVGLK